MGIRTFCQLLSATCDIPSAIFADKKFSIVLEQITKPVGAQLKFTRVVGSSGHKLCVGLGKDMICLIPAISSLVGSFN
jgi:hypothetical protein